jgi:hypothetical protein
MFCFSVSGATYFSVCALFSFPKAPINSGSFCPPLSLCAWRDFKVDRKSNLPGADLTVSTDLIELVGDDTGEGDFDFGNGSGLSFERPKGLAAGSGGGDFDFATAGED